MPERVVLDTNILISSIFWELGKPHAIVRLALQQQISSFTSPEMLLEMEESQKRDFDVPEEFIQRQISLFKTISTIIEPTIQVIAVQEDPKDDKVLSCAIAAKAEFIVTGDRHLLKLKQYQGVSILTPAEFLSRIEHDKGAGAG
ncbi:putative toxin-antitoxin system toxin component, PIN family [Candidatus Woesearchaeota archaeon]|nr:putative toxin-antitoxin system toxin component, PIN family [Candidatus Woesearchaeota archaeon]